MSGCTGNCNQGRTCKCDAQIQRETPVLCKDCAHFDDPMCMHPEAIVQINLIDGRESYKAATQMRYNGACGQQGVFFEQREVVSNKIVQFFRNCGII